MLIVMLKTIVTITDHVFIAIMLGLCLETTTAPKTDRVLEIYFVRPDMKPQRISGPEIAIFWCVLVFLMCSFKVCLDLKVLSQRLQGMATPSRWLASI